MNRRKMIFAMAFALAAAPGIVLGASKAHLLGVVDLDADGRKELVIALRFPTVRTVVVYSAGQSAQRLDLVGEAQSFQK